MLDVTAAVDLSSWAWKDSVLLALAAALGAVPAEHAARVRRQGESAVERLEARAFPLRRRLVPLGAGPGLDAAAADPDRGPHGRVITGPVRERPDPAASAPTG